MDHPVLAEKLTSGSDDARTRFLREKLEWALDQLETLDGDCTHAEALKAWDKVFDTTYFSDHDGSSTKAAITSAALIKSVDEAGAARAVDKRGGGRYG